jgi:hypothetical protein
MRVCHQPRPTEGAVHGGRLRSPSLALTLLFTLACAERGEPAACLDKRQQARNGALQDRLEEAARLLEQIKAECGPNSASDIQHIGKLIAEKRAARQQREQQAEAARALQRQFPSRDFVAWATSRDGAITGKTAGATCSERGSTDFGFCEAKRPGANEMTVRYHGADQNAYRYALTTTEPPSCEDLGEYRRVRVWTRGGVSYEHCELTSRRLRHLSALLVHEAAEHRMYIYSQEYPSRDAAFERMLRIIPAAD